MFFILTAKSSFHAVYSPKFSPEMSCGGTVSRFAKTSASSSLPQEYTNRCL